MPKGPRVIIAGKNSVLHYTVATTRTLATEEEKEEEKVVR